MRKRLAAPKAWMCLTAVLILGWACFSLATALERRQGNEELLRSVGLNDVVSTKRLLDKGADPNAVHRELTLETAVRLAIHLGIDKPGSRTTALFVALDPAAGKPGPQHWPPPEHMELVRTLLEHGAQVNICDSTGQTPLMRAVCADWPEITRMLLQHHADPNLTHESATTAVIDSIWLANDIRLTRMLIGAGADINQQTTGGKDTALMLAARLDKTPFVKLLVGGGANLAIVNADGDTALKIARETQAGPDTIKFLNGSL